MTINEADIALLAYVRTCAIKYPNMTIKRCVELADKMAGDIKICGFPGNQKVILKSRGDKEEKPAPLDKKKEGKKGQLYFQEHEENGLSYGAIAKKYGEKNRNVVSGIIHRYRQTLGIATPERRKPRENDIVLRANLKPENPNDDTALIQKHIDDGKVTKCPTRYADGFGFHKMEIAGETV